MEYNDLVSCCRDWFNVVWLAVISVSAPFAHRLLVVDLRNFSKHVGLTVLKQYFRDLRKEWGATSHSSVTNCAGQLLPRQSNYDCRCRNRLQVCKADHFLQTHQFPICPQHPHKINTTVIQCHLPACRTGYVQSSFFPRIIADSSPPPPPPPPPPPAGGDTQEQTPSKHWFTTSFGGRCRKTVLGVCFTNYSPPPTPPHPNTHTQLLLIIQTANTAYCNKSVQQQTNKKEERKARILKKMRVGVQEKES